MMTCDICNPKVRGYTVYFSNDQYTNQLKNYFSNYAETDWFEINERMFWTLEPIFFNLMDYIDNHMNAKEIYAVEAKSADPLRELHDLTPIKQFQESRTYSWIDDLILSKSILTHFQPIVSVENKQVSIIGNELLSRGLDENQEIISPFHMFEAARKRNRLFALDRVCRLESINNSAPAAKNDQLIFVNFIPTAIYVPEHCLATTFALIKKLGIHPDQVVFEVVETDKVEDMAHLLSILDYYRSRGVKYALDDVGTGFNDLGTLSRMQPDYVKLAREYTDGVSTDSAKSAVAKSVLEMSHHVGAQALAEGVERVEDLEYLMDMGYDLYQGYLFAKPVEIPVDHIDNSLIFNS